MRIIATLMLVGLSACAAQSGDRRGPPVDYRPYLGDWVSEDGASRRSMRLEQGDLRAQLFLREDEAWVLASEGGCQTLQSIDGAEDYFCEYRSTGAVDMGFDLIRVDDYQASTSSFSAPGLPDFVDGGVFYNRASRGDQVMLTYEHWTPPQDGRFTYTLYQPTETGGWTEWFSGTWIRVEEAPE